MRMRRFIPLVFILLLFSVLGTAFVFQLFEKKYVLEEMPIVVRVGNKVGIDVNTSALTFGTLPPGLSAERMLHIRAEKNERLYFFVTNISFIFLDEYALIVAPNETQHLRVTAAPPLSTQAGEYRGKLLIMGEKTRLEIL